MRAKEKNQESLFFFQTGDQSGRLDGHHVLRAGRPLVLGLGVLRSAHCGKMFRNFNFFFIFGPVLTRAICRMAWRLMRRSPFPRVVSVMDLFLLAGDCWKANEARCVRTRVAPGRAALREPIGRCGRAASCSMFKKRLGGVAF